LEASDAARRKTTTASTKSFCNDPARAAALLQRGLQGLQSSRPSKQQLQQLQQFGRAHKLVMQADRHRSSSTPNLQAAAALYKQAAEMGSASGQFSYAQMIQHRQVDVPVAAALPWLLKAASQEPELSCMPGCPNVGVVESWVMLGDMYR
jgi:TPR repeat protein